MPPFTQPKGIRLWGNPSCVNTVKPVNTDHTEVPPLSRTPLGVERTKPRLLVPHKPTLEERVDWVCAERRIDLRDIEVTDHPNDPKVGLLAIVQVPKVNAPTEETMSHLRTEFEH